MTPEIEALFRAVLLRIGTCHSYLAPVGQDSSFTVVLEMDGMRPSPEAKSKDLKEPTPKDLRAIIPVKNISIADLQLGLFIEKLVPSGDHQLQTPK
ncbi:hypothetical protein BGW38_008141 [Lunasporangiospora selenospora]|uniref:Uncharacterized protein n=1 Tax=Lunasporangiospora selenospora TaxID=979761 RepID=A0A9P6G090_9FUNG|nr:hypothetical protein BGW38_008141 [Lunasporangiospora selenospora]